MKLLALAIDGFRGIQHANIRFGTHDVIIGPNGAGKSTLVKLLTRMYDPDGGVILLDDLPLAAYDLDALRRRVAIAPGKAARIAFWTVVASSREELVDLIDTHHDRSAYERARTLAWTQAHVQLHHLDIEAGEALVYDYFLYDGEGEAPCHCGAPKCRGTMYSPKEVQKRKRSAKKPANTSRKAKSTSRGSRTKPAKSGGVKQRTRPRSTR